jgi:hypothetical protein
MVCGLVFTKSPLFHNFIFFCSNNIRVFLKVSAELQSLHPIFFIITFSVVYILLDCGFVF